MKEAGPGKDPIYVDASQPATLIYSGKSDLCPTLEKAVLAWRRLPAQEKETAIIKSAGKKYTADEIYRLYHTPRQSDDG